MSKAPGVYADLSNDEYHGGPGVSKSGLDLIRRSPMHFKAAMELDPMDREPTKAQCFGTACHSIILEPEKFYDEYVPAMERPEGALDTMDDLKEVLKAHGAKISGTKAQLIERVLEVDPEAVILDRLKSQWAAANAGRVILSREDWDVLHAMRDAVMAHPAAAALLDAPGKAEQSVYWEDQATGELCRCRPDWWRDDGILVDVKTTEDAGPEEFARSVAKYRYHVQSPFYLDGVEQAIRQAGLDLPTPRAFVFLSIEKKPPYAVAVYQLDKESQDLGRRQYAEDLEVLAECKRTESWPGYGERIQQLALPGWYLQRAAFAEAG